jgi:hypothetical protein
MPAAAEIRVERKNTVDRRQHGTDIRVEISQCEGCIDQDSRVAGHLQGSPW